MDRRKFIGVVAGGLFAAPLVAKAQQPRSVRRIGLLTGGVVTRTVSLFFFDALRERGWIEGQTLVSERREGNGNSERVPSLAAELVELKARRDRDIRCRRGRGHEERHLCSHRRYKRRPDSSRPGFEPAASRRQQLREAARIGLQVRLSSATNEHEIDTAFATFEQQPPGALVVGFNIFSNSRREQIVVLAARDAGQAIYDLRDWLPVVA